MKEWEKRWREKKRKKIFDITNGRCFYCGCNLDFDDFHTDHFFPKVKGGKDERNLVPSCPECNMSKGDLTIDEWRSKIENILDSSSKTRLIKKFYGVKPQKIKFFFEVCNGER